MKKSWGIAAKVSTTVLIAALFLFSALALLGFGSLERTLAGFSRQAAATIASAVDIEVARVAGEVEELAREISNSSDFSSRWILYKDSVASRRLYAKLGDRLLENPIIMGLGVLIDPQSWDDVPDEQKYAPFAIRSGDHFAVTDLADFDPDYLSSRTYLSAKEGQRTTWGTPFFAAEVNRGAVTCAYPFEHGVVLCDISTAWLGDVAARLGAPHGGGIVVRTPDSHTLINTTGISQLPNLSPLQGEELTEATVDGKRYLYLGAVLEETGWTQAIIFSRDALREAAKKDLQPALLAGAAAALILAVCAWLAASRSSRALAGLNDSVLRIAEAGLDAPATEVVGGGSEVQLLSASLETMRAAIRNRVEGLRDDLVKNQGNRREAELAVEIRNRGISHRHPEDAKYALAAIIDDGTPPGGDFYDFLTTDRGSLYLIVGRVSTSGIGASVTSNALLSYLRAISRSAAGPAIAMSSLGEFFESGGWRQPEEIEIQLLLVEFYPSTGTCSIASAGAGRPLIVHEGSVSFSDMAEGAALRSDRRSFATGIANLAKGDRVILYTGALDEHAEREGETIPVTDAVANLFSAGDLTGDELLAQLVLLKRSQTPPSNPLTREDVTFLLLHYR